MYSEVEPAPPYRARPLRVIVLTTARGPTGGIERYGDSVIRALEELGCAVTISVSSEWTSHFTRIVELLRIWRGLSSADLLWIVHPRHAFVARVLGSLARRPFVA